jgi:hypothetical protein
MVIPGGASIQGGIKLSGNAQTPGLSMPIYFEILARSTIGLRATYLADEEVIDYISYYSSFSIDTGLHASLAAKSIYLSPVYGISTVSLSGNSANSSIIASVGMSVSSLTDISTINGAAYPPVASLPSNAVVSTLTAATSVSTPALFVSSVNGAVYPPVATVPSNLVVSTLVAADYVSSTRINTSSVGAGLTVVSFDALNGNIDINPNGGDVTVEGASLTVNTDIIANYSMYVSSLVNVSSINGAAYPPVASLPSAAVVSTLVAATSVSTPALFVSSINGASLTPSSIANGLGYINIDADGAISTTTGGLKTFAVDANGQISLRSNAIGLDLWDTDGGSRITMNGSIAVSGSAFNLGSVPTSVSTLVGVATINGAAYPPTASIPSALTVSTLVAADFVSSPVLFVSSINNAPYPPPSGASSNGEFSTVVVSSILTAKDIVTTSSLTMGDPNTSTCAFIRSPVGVGSADIVVELGVVGATKGALRVYNGYTLGTGGILESRQLYNISSISNTLGNGNDITLTAGPGTAGVTGYVNITDPITPYGKLRVAEITELSSIKGVSFPNDTDIAAGIVKAEIGFELAGAGTFTINNNTGSEGQVISIVGGYPEWSDQALIKQSISSIITPSTFTYVLNPIDLGTYFVLSTDAAGSPPYTVDFIALSTLGASTLTFSIKNTDFTNQIPITITRDGGINAMGNNQLFPPSPSTNSAYCVCNWDGSNLYVY